MNCFTVFTWQTRPARAALNFWREFFPPQPNWTEVAWMDSKQTDKNTKKRANEEKMKKKTKQKQNKTKQKTSKLNKEWLLEKKKKKKKKKKTSNLNEEWPLNESSMYCLSQEKKFFQKLFICPGNSFMRFSWQRRHC